MPMTLWSTLKIYFRMKPLGSAIGACTVDPPACACELMRGLLEIGCRLLGVSWSESWVGSRSEEHTSELQSHHDLVCRLLLEKKKKTNARHRDSPERTIEDLTV